MKLAPDYKSRASARKHRVKILRKQSIREGVHVVEVWEPIKECWASVMPLSERMRTQYQAISVVASHSITVAGSLDIMESDKIEFGSRRFDILTIRDAAENKRDKVIITQEIRPGQK